MVLITLTWQSIQIYIVSDITIVDSPHKDNLSISEQLRNIPAEHHSKYLKSKRNKNAIPEKPLEKTPISVTPVIQEDNFLSNGNPNKWPEGAICIVGDSILNGIDGSLLSQKQLVKVRQFSGAAITDMYDHLKPILKRHPKFLILHTGTNDTSKYTPNEIVDKVLALKRFVVSQNEECKVIISTLTMCVDNSKNGNGVQKVNEILKELDIPLVKSFNIVKKHLGNRSPHLNEHGTSRLEMNYIATIRKLWNIVNYPKCDFDLKPIKPTETFKTIESNCEGGSVWNFEKDSNK